MSKGRIDNEWGRVEPSLDDWTRWLHFNQATEDAAAESIQRASQKMVAVLEVISQAPLAYKYVNDDWSKTMHSQGGWKSSLEDFYPTASWMARCERVGVSVVPWNWPTWVDAWRQIWDDLFASGIAVDISVPTSQMNKLLRVFVITGTYIECFAFEVSAKSAGLVKESIETASTGPILIEPEDVLFLKEERMRRYEKVFLDQMQLDWDQLG